MATMGVAGHPHFGEGGGSSKFGVAEPPPIKKKIIIVGFWPLADPLSWP